MAKAPEQNGRDGGPTEAAGAAKPGPAPIAAGTIGPEMVKFDTSDLKSTYCNVCNGTSTREEVVINFGVNSTWDMSRDKIEVALQHRIVMSPHAAKRVRDMMVKLIEEHESRYGKLSG
jgi:hypothetical protein